MKVPTLNLVLLIKVSYQLYHIIEVGVGVSAYLRERASVLLSIKKLLIKGSLKDDPLLGPQKTFFLRILSKKHEMKLMK